MAMVKHTFPLGSQPTILTADLCHVTIGIPGESYRDCAACPGMTTAGELGAARALKVDPGEAVLCICECHLKRNQA